MIVCGNPIQRRRLSLNFLNMNPPAILFTAMNAEEMWIVIIHNIVYSFERHSTAKLSVPDMPRRINMLLMSSYGSANRREVLSKTKGNCSH